MISTGHYLNVVLVGTIKIFYHLVHYFQGSGLPFLVGPSKNYWKSGWLSTVGSGTVKILPISIAHL